MVRISEYLWNNHLIYHKLDLGEPGDVVLGSSGRNEGSVEEAHQERLRDTGCVAHTGNGGWFEGQDTCERCWVRIGNWVSRGRQEPVSQSWRKPKRSDRLGQGKRPTLPVGFSGDSCLALEASTCWGSGASIKPSVVSGQWILPSLHPPRKELHWLSFSLTPLVASIASSVCLL